MAFSIGRLKALLQSKSAASFIVWTALLGLTALALTLIKRAG